MSPRAIPTATISPGFAPSLVYLDSTAEPNVALAVNAIHDRNGSQKPERAADTRQAQSEARVAANKRAATRAA